MHFSKGRRQQAAVQMQTAKIECPVKNLKCTVAQWTLIEALLIQVL
jgi:hypothetical protein